MFNALRILLGWSGRIGRRTWLAGLFFLVFLYPTLVVVAMTAAADPRGAAKVMAGAALLGLWIVLALAAKRLRDMGRSPLWALAPAAPLALMMARLPPAAHIALRHGEFEVFGTVFIAPDPLFAVAIALQSALAVWLLLGGPNPRAPGERLAFVGGRRALAPPPPPPSPPPRGGAAPPTPPSPPRPPPPPPPRPPHLGAPPRVRARRRRDEARPGPAAPRRPGDRSPTLRNVARDRACARRRRRSRAKACVAARAAL